MIEAPQPMIHQITAQLNHSDAGDLCKDCYAYDYAEIGLEAEPLIHPTTEAIIEALNCNDISTLTTFP